MYNLVLCCISSIHIWLPCFAQQKFPNLLWKASIESHNTIVASLCIEKYQNKDKVNDTAAQVDGCTS